MEACGGPVVGGRWSPMGVAGACCGDVVPLMPTCEKTAGSADVDADLPMSVTIVRGGDARADAVGAALPSGALCVW